MIGIQNRLPIKNDEVPIQKLQTGMQKFISEASDRTPESENYK